MWMHGEDIGRDIVSTVQAMLQSAIDRQAEWPPADRLDDRTNRLLSTALILYRTRLVDLYIREQVLILWLIDGVVRLRVHSGICYLYGDAGSFDAYKGLPSEHIFFRIKAFLLVVEGLFRLMPRDTNRTDDDVWSAIVKMVNDAGTETRGTRSAQTQLFSQLVVEGEAQVVVPVEKVVRRMHLLCLGTSSLQKASAWWR